MSRRQDRSAFERLVDSPVNYWLALSVDVAGAIGFLIAGLRLGGASLVGLALATLGFILWSAAEYAGHRWLFHGPPSAASRAHARHHANPAALISTPAFLSLVVACGLGGLLTLAVSAGAAALLVFGFYAGYNYYVLVHHVQHRHAALVARLPGLTRLEQAHRLHHTFPSLNYGVSTRWWDYALGSSASRLGPGDAKNPHPRAFLVRIP